MAERLNTDIMYVCMCLNYLSNASNLSTKGSVRFKKLCL